MLLKPPLFAKRSCFMGRTCVCTPLELSPNRNKAQQHGGLEGFQQSWLLHPVSHSGFTTETPGPSSLFRTWFVQMASHLEHLLSNIHGPFQKRPPTVNQNCIESVAPPGALMNTINFCRSGQKCRGLHAVLT